MITEEGKERQGVATITEGQKPTLTIELKPEETKIMRTEETEDQNDLKGDIVLIQIDTLKDDANLIQKYIKDT